jgi:hypothetical protein
MAEFLKNLMQSARRINFVPTHDYEVARIHMLVSETSKFILYARLSSKTPNHKDLVVSLLPRTFVEDFEDFCFAFIPRLCRGIYCFSFALRICRRL